MMINNDADDFVIFPIVTMHVCVYVCMCRHMPTNANSPIVS